MRKTKQPIPFARIAGLLSFSIFTLLGVLAGLPPEVVLARVSIGTGLVILMTIIGVKLLGLMSV